jgi:hypothetical protein
MFKMKQALVLSLAALAIASQAHAVGEKDSRSDAERKAAIDRAAHDAGKDVGGHSRNAVQTSARDVLAAAGIHMSPDAHSRLNKAMASDSKIHDAAKEALTFAQNNPDARAIVAAQMEGLANLGGIDQSQASQAMASMDPSVKAQHSYYTLVTKVAIAARSWKGSSRDIATELLLEANKVIATRKDPSDLKQGLALLDAKKVVQSQTQKDIDLDSIFKFCENI